MTKMELKEQRDELLAALKALVEIDDTNDQFMDEDWDNARAAIARAEKGGQS